MAKKQKQQWRGIFKLVEEMSELSVELAKLGPFPDGNHPGRSHNLRETVQEEVADVRAALNYFVRVNKLKISETRTRDKRDKFNKWGLTGIIDLESK